MQVKPMAFAQCLAIAAAALIVAGCDSEPAQPQQWVYHCGAQPIIVTDMGSESIDVLQDGTTFRLVATSAASGTRYVSADQQVEFWSKGHEATFNQQGNALPLCILDGHLPSEFTARGNEPSWQLSSTELSLQETRETTPRQWLLHDAKGHAVELTARHCVDSMSGRYYPYQARYSRGDEQLVGCAGDSQRLLAGSNWQLVGNFSDATRPLLQFGSDNSVTGFTGCNNFRGSYQLSPETFAFDPLAITRKACETEVMAAEHDFLRQLLEVEQFSFDADGRLQLHPRGAELLVLEKTSAPKA